MKTHIRLNRRRFLGGVATLASATGVGVVPEWAQSAPKAKRGGTCRVAISDGSTSDKLDPATTVSEYMIDLNWAIRNNLTEIDRRNRIVGELASSFEQSNGAKRWVFSIREGVEFHDGKPLRTSDVVASIDYHRKKSSASAAKSLLNAVEHIKADGKNTVLFELSEGNADFPYVLADYHFVILPSDGEGNVDWKSGTGTGGYILESFQPGVTARLKRFANYWKRDAAYFDSAELLAIADSTARMSALLTGEIDVMANVDPRIVQLLEKRPDIGVDEVPSSQHISAPMNTTVAPFTANEIRLALKYAIDREGLLREILRGHGTIGNDQPISPIMPYYAADIPQRHYDPEKARFHLKKAGVSGLTVQLFAADVFDGDVDSAILYSLYAKKAGINIKVVREPTDGFWSGVWMKKPWTLVEWGGRPTPDMMLSVIYGAKSAWNDTFWHPEKFNKILIEARSELDQTKRRELYRELQLMVRDQGGSVIPAFMNYLFARRKDIEHSSSLSSDRTLDGHRALERWWHA